MKRLFHICAFTVPWLALLATIFSPLPLLAAEHESYGCPTGAVRIHLAAIEKTDELRDHALKLVGLIHRKALEGRMFTLEKTEHNIETAGYAILLFGPSYWVKTYTAFYGGKGDASILLTRYKEELQRHSIGLRIGHRKLFLKIGSAHIFPGISTNPRVLHRISIIPVEICIWENRSEDPSI